jgi:hypothetical protein
MNIEDRVALYAEVCRMLPTGGRFVTYDLVLRDGNVVYRAPWARDVSTGFLLKESDTAGRFNKSGSRRFSRATTPRPRSTGSRQPRLAVERTEPRSSDGCGFPGHDRQSGPQPPRELPRRAVHGPDPGLELFAARGLFEEGMAMTDRMVLARTAAAGTQRLRILAEPLRCAC